MERNLYNIERSDKTPLELLGLLACVFVVMSSFLSIGCKPPRIEEFQENAIVQESGTSEARQAVDEDSLVLAIVDDKAITLAEFQRRVRVLTPMGQRRISSEMTRHHLLEALIDLHLFAAQAKADGFSNDPLVRQAEQAALRDVILERLVSASLSQMSEIGDEQVRDLFVAESFRYQRPTQSRVGLIVLPDRAEAIAVATAYRRRLDLDIQASMELFERLAAEHSIAPPQAVDLGFVSRADLGEVASPEVVEAVFALTNAGQSSDPIPVAGGQAMFCLIERRHSVDRGIDEVAETIREQIVDRQRREAIDAALAHIRSEAAIEIDDNLLAQLETVSAERRPPTAQRPWDSLSDAEQASALSPQRDLGFLGELLLPPPEEPPMDGETDGDEGE